MEVSGLRHLKSQDYFKYLGQLKLFATTTITTEKPTHPIGYLVMTKYLFQRFPNLLI